MAQNVASNLTESVVHEVSKRVVGQDAMIERLLIALLTGGHVLLEGVPGLAKTLAVRTLAESVHTRSTAPPPRCSPRSSRRCRSIR
jgi:MoxR-like ATPase